MLYQLSYRGAKWPFLGQPRLDGHSLALCAFGGNWEGDRAGSLTAMRGECAVNETVTKASIAVGTVIVYSSRS